VQIVFSILLLMAQPCFISWNNRHLERKNKMANNIHVSYDLYTPGQNYDSLTTAIKGLGNWAKIHKSFWYVNTTMSATQVAEYLWKLMDNNDTLYVVDSTNNMAAWRNLPKDVEDQIKDQWYK